VYTAINDRSSIQYGRRTQQNVILLKRDQIQDFVDNTARELEAGTFRAEKYTDSKGSRKFTLLPIFSMQAGHVQLDLETLPPILRRAGLITRRTLSEEEFLRVVWQNFDFTHIGFERVEDLFTQDIEWR
jgi:hypothetical protein